MKQDMILHSDSQNMPKVCVVVLNWNGRELLRKCLNTVVQSEYYLHKIIVADNGSTDGSVQMIRESFPNVIIVENSENLGVPEGKNRGIIRALEEHADYIYTLDNDLIMNSKTIKELVLLMEMDQTIGCSGSIIYDSIEKDLILSAGHYINWTQNLVKPVAANQRDIGQLRQCIEVDYVGAGAMLTRASIFDEIGLLDPDFIGYGYDDADFGMRVNGAGYKVVCHTPSKVWHRPFSAIGRYSFKKKYLESRNAIRFLRIYGNRWNWVKFLFYVIAGLIYASIVEGARGNMGGVIGKARGFYDGFRGREDLARRLLQV